MIINAKLKYRSALHSYKRSARSLSRLLIRILIILAFISTTNLDASDDQADYVITTDTVLNNNEEIVLMIRLTNISSQDINLYDANLPWAHGTGGTAFIKLVVPDKHVPKNIPMRIPIFDYLDTSLLIPNNSTIAGEINLSEMIPNISDLLDDADILVFWLYQPILTDGLKLSESSGVVRINKRIKK